MSRAPTIWNSSLFGEQGQRGDPDSNSHALRTSFFTAEQPLQCSNHYMEVGSLSWPKLPVITGSHRALLDMLVGRRV